MDFTFTPDEEQFRAEMRQFLAGALPEDWSRRAFIGDLDPDEHEELARRVTKALADRRWLAMPWAEEFGGLGASHMQQLIYNEETSYHRMPGGGGQGVAWVGPAIQLYGNEEQQQTYLPRIATGEDVWCTLYSEPGAGTDLASLQTRAIRDGDEYVVNGVKIWASGAQRANLGWLAARTDPDAPKHRGISTFVVPMDTPGIAVRPIATMAGDNNLNEVYFENVRIPARNLVGTENRGWYQATTTLDLERSGVGAYATGKHDLELLVDAAKDEDSRIKENPGARYEIADRWIELQVGFNVAYRIPYLQSQGMVPNHEASVSKLYGAEMTQRIAGTGMHLLGPAGQLAPGSPYAALGGAFSRHYLATVAATIAAGTSEIQRTIIAQRGLGMPR